VEAMRWTLCLLAGCVPELIDDTPYVDEPRVLAIRLDPPEAVPGATVRASALFADAEGLVDGDPFVWSFCVARKPLAELGPVSPRCYEPGEAWEAMDGAQGALPADGCARFGPNPPPAEAGESGGRPVDPDPSGGYYQPVVASRPAVDEEPTLAFARLRCGIPNVNQETFVAWNRAYRDNVSPMPETLSVVGEAGTVVPWEGTGDAIEVQAGATMTLEVAWPACPDSASCGDGVCSPEEDVTTCRDDCEIPTGCNGAERYVVWDTADKILRLRREALSIAWYVTGGTVAEARTGRSADDPERTSRNEWTAPSSAGEVWGAVVLRDDRGGVGYRSFRVRVRDP